VRRFCSLGAARAGFPHGLHFSCCIYLHHTQFGSGTALLYTSDRHLTQIHPTCLLTKRASPLTIQKTDLAFLFLRLVTILFSSTVAVASNVLYFDTPNSDECGTVVLLELPFFSVPKRRYTCYVTPRILDKQNRRQVGTGWVTLKLPGYGC